jgi:hypothetical protein
MPNPVTAVVGKFGDVIVPTPETNVHTPIAGEMSAFAFSVVLFVGKQMF